LGSVYFNSEKECNLVFGYVRLAVFFGHIILGHVRCMLVFIQYYVYIIDVF